MDVVVPVASPAPSLDTGGHPGYGQVDTIH